MSSNFLDDLMTSWVIQNNIRSICCDTISAALLTGLDAYLIDYDTIPVKQNPNSSPDYPKTGVDYGADASTDYKCQVAFYITDAVAEFFEAAAEKQRRSMLVTVGGSGQTALAIAGILRVMDNPVVVSMAGLISWTEALLAAYYSFGDTLADRCEARATYLRDNRAALACLLYNAVDTASARSSFVQNLADPAPGGGYDPLEIAVVHQLLTNTLLNSLFFENPQIDVSGISEDCAEC
jgi:hypothetical protein